MWLRDPTNHIDIFPSLTKWTLWFYSLMIISWWAYINIRLYDLTINYIGKKYRWKKWILGIDQRMVDEKPKGSVVYIALGSEVTVGLNEINELACGLELSRKHSFGSWESHRDREILIRLCYQTISTKELKVKA